LLEQAAVISGISGNLYRLQVEYRRTQRRARALEDVLLPEIETSLSELSARLEEQDQEEAVRVRLPHRQ
jgi:V/A-type H+-transporting ATPase subunit D